MNDTAKAAVESYSQAVVMEFGNWLQSEIISKLVAFRIHTKYGDCRLLSEVETMARCFDKLAKLHADYGDLK